MQNLSGKNGIHLHSLDLHENLKNHFHISGFALSLALKQRLRTTWKWPNTTIQFSSRDCVTQI